MNTRDLGWLMQLLERHGLKGDGITIHGKGAKRISFTAPRADYSAINNLCEMHNMKFSTTADQFISRHLDRYQLWLPEADNG